MTQLTAIETDLSSRRLFVAVLISHEERLAENILVFLSVAYLLAYLSLQFFMAEAGGAAPTFINVSVLAVFHGRSRWCRTHIY